MHRRWTALILIICMLLPCVCTAEDARPRLDAAQYIVYRISDGKYRVMDFEGRFVGEDTEAFPSEKIGEAAFYMEHGEFGFVANDGTIVVEPQYYDVPEFEKGYGIVCKMDIDGEARDFSGGIGTPMFGRVYGVINAYGDVIVPAEYESVHDIYTGDKVDYAIVNVSGGNHKLEGLFNLTDGRVAIAPKYFSLEVANDDFLIAGQATLNCDPEDVNESASGSEYDYEYGVIDLQEDVLIPLEYDMITFSAKKGVFNCLMDNQIVKVYEIRNGAVVEKAESPHIMMERQNKGGMKR